jgi:predicted outer membrane repeat protein
MLTIPCFAATYTVDDDGPADFNSIQAAIDTADNNDTVIVYPGIYYESVEIIDKAITLRSSGPNDPCTVAATIIDGNDIFRCIDVAHFNLIISGFTIRNGHASVGAGIRLLQSSCVVSYCTFINNNAEDTGGAMRCSGPVTIKYCNFTENYTGSSGGAVYLYSSHSIIANCDFSQNYAEKGGGAVVCTQYCNVDFNNCSFTKNQAFSGGAISNSWYSNLTFADCTFTENKAGVDAFTPWGDNCGGAINSGGGGQCSLTLSECSFNSNRANFGGGISCNNAELNNCIFTGNLSFSGGGICSWNENAMLRNCTFSQNKAVEYGGGVSCKGSDVSITNSIAWANIAIDGNEIALESSSINVNYCDIKSGLPGIYIYDSDTINWGPGNIDIDPCFVSPGYWDPNGTPADANDDFWVDGDYHLKSAGWRWDSVRNRWDYDDVTSRCIDASNPGPSLADEPLTIPDDPNNLWGQNLRINMGAYGGTAKASMPPYDWALLCDIDNNGTVDFSDYASLAMLWMQQGDELFNDFNHDTKVDANDLYLLTEDWLKTTTWH